jgi:hypothetical protein
MDRTLEKGGYYATILNLHIKVHENKVSTLNLHLHTKVHIQTRQTQVCLLNKSSCLAPPLDATKFIANNVKNWVTPCCPA